MRTAASPAAACAARSESPGRARRRAGAAAWLAAAALVWAGATGCQKAAPEPTASAAPALASAAVEGRAVPRPVPVNAPGAPRAPSAVASGTASTPAPEPDAPYRHAAAPRVVALGDLHGDLAATRRALRLAGAIDAQDRWVGGALVVVQTGDELDRGDDDRQIVELFDRIADAARAAGGAVYALNGNHEVMNVAADFRYVTPGGFAAFSDVDTSRVPRAVLEQFPVQARGRVAAFHPGGPMARRLAERDVVAVVGDTAFVHGGVTAEHVRYGIARLNREVRRWMAGEGAPPAIAQDPEGPVWTRRYSDDRAAVDCEGLGRALAALQVKRLVVGHTVHEEGISPACDARVWRIDVGMSSFYGGSAQVLEIRGDAVTVLR